MIRTLNAVPWCSSTDQGVHTQTADGLPGPDFGGSTTTGTRTDAGGRAADRHAARRPEQFDVAFDQEVEGRLIQPDGRVLLRPCLPGSPVDCVAYGAFTGDNAPALGSRRSHRSSARPSCAVRSSDSSFNDFRLQAIRCRRTMQARPAPACACGGAGTDAETPTVDAGSRTGVRRRLRSGDGDGSRSTGADHRRVTSRTRLASAATARCCGSQVADISCLIRMASTTRCQDAAWRSATPTAAGIPGGTATATVPQPTRTPGGALGVRHFSFDPAKARWSRPSGRAPIFHGGLHRLPRSLRRHSRPDQRRGVRRSGRRRRLSLTGPSLGGGAVCLPGRPQPTAGAQRRHRRL